MQSGRILTAPDGARWRVRRRWSNRPLPRPWRGWRPRGEDTADPGGRGWGWGWGWGWVDPFDACDGADDFLAGIALVVAVALVIALIGLVILPLLGVALELAVAIAIFGSSVFGRVFLGRPWTIEAVNLDDPAQTGTYAVKGWRRSRRALLDLGGAIQSAGLPAHLPAAEPLSAAS